MKEMNKVKAYKALTEIFHHDILKNVTLENIDKLNAREFQRLILEEKSYVKRILSHLVYLFFDHFEKEKPVVQKERIISGLPISLYHIDLEWSVKYNVQSSLITYASSRIKSDLSLATKIVNELDENSYKSMYDLFGVKFIVTSDSGCFELGKFIEKNFFVYPHTKDYINNPKKSGYRSLHYTIKFSGIAIEIQIKTEEMEKVDKETREMYKSIITNNVQSSQKLLEIRKKMLVLFNTEEHEQHKIHRNRTILLHMLNYLHNKNNFYDISENIIISYLERHNLPNLLIDKYQFSYFLNIVDNLKKSLAYLNTLEATWSAEKISFKDINKLDLKIKRFVKKLSKLEKKKNELIEYGIIHPTIQIFSEFEHDWPKIKEDYNIKAFLDRPKLNQKWFEEKDFKLIFNSFHIWFYGRLWNGKLMLGAGPIQRLYKFMKELYLCYENYFELRYYIYSKSKAFIYR